MFCGLQDKMPIQVIPPEFDGELEEQAKSEFENTFPEADTEMDVHAAQLKALVWETKKQ